MTKKELMIKAHQMTKEIKNEYPEVNYKFQLGLCLAYLCENKGEVEVIEYKTGRGTTVEIALNGKLITDLTVNGVELFSNRKSDEHECYLTKGLIVINSKFLYKKLGSNSVIRIEMNEEVKSIYEAESKKRIEKLERERKAFIENTKISADEYLYSFEKHMTDKNI